MICPLSLSLLWRQSDGGESIIISMLLDLALIQSITGKDPACLVA